MRYGVIVALISAFALGTGPARASSPPTLEERAVAIERASKEVDGVRVVVGHISRELSIPVETLRAQRARTGLDWGEILIANRLARRAGAPFDEIAAEFASGKGWEEIARTRNVDVSALMDDVERAQDVIENRAEDRGPRVDPAERQGKPARTGGPRRGGAGRDTGRY